MKISLIAAGVCFLMVFPVFGNVASALNNQTNQNNTQNVIINNISDTNDSLKTNLTVNGEDGYTYSYSSNGTFLSRSPTTSSNFIETEQKNITKIKTEEFFSMINNIINGNTSLYYYYYNLKASGMDNSTIYNSILKKKQLINDNDLNIDNKTIKTDYNINQIQEIKKDKYDSDDLGHTYGFGPQTRDNNWNEVLYDHFDDLNYADWSTYTGGSGGISIGSSMLDIYSSGAGYAYTRGIPLDIYTTKPTNDYIGLRYSITMKFQLGSVTYPNNHWIYLIKSNQIDILIDQYTDGTTFLQYYDTSPHYVWGNFAASTWYTLSVVYNLDNNTYIIRLYNSNNGLLKSYAPCNAFGTSEAPTFFIGDTDTTGDNNVNLLIDYINVYGHTKAKSFDNFDNSFWYDWRVQMESTQSETMTVQNNDLRIKATDNGMSLANSGYVDYSSLSSYTMAIYFQIQSSSNHWFRLIDNGPIAIYIGNNWVDGNYLYYYASPSSPANFIASLTYENQNPGTKAVWYYLEVIVNPTPSCKFSVYLNDPAHRYSPIVPATTSCAVDGNGNTIAARNYLRVGNGPNDWSDGIIKYIKLLATIGTDDGDGFTDTYEDQPYLQIFGDDFQSQWSSDNSWKFDSTNIGWTIGSPSNPNGPSHCAADTDQCAGIGMYNWPTAGQTYYLYSPAISVLDINQAQNIVLVFDYWLGSTSYTQTAKVQITKSNTFNNPGTSFTDLESLSTTSGWVNLHTKIIVPSTIWTGSTYIFFRFIYYVAASQNVGGEFIDNIKLYAAIPHNAVDIDADGDGLTNGVEYYLYGSSPVRYDTDEDGFYDYMEISYNDLNDPILDNGPANPSDQDIFIEVDYMHSNNLFSATISHLKTKFQDHGIKLHLINGGMYNRYTDFTTQYKTYSNCVNDYRPTDFENNIGAYHYLCLFYMKSTFDYVDWGEAGYTPPPQYNSIVWNTAVTVSADWAGAPEDVNQAAVIMHELGHNLYQNDNIGKVMDQGVIYYNWNFDYTFNSWQSLELANSHT